MSSRTLLMGTGRGTGKTTRIIDLADAFGAVIVTPTADSAKNIKHMAGNGMRSIETIPFTDMERMRERVGDRRVVVDDADRILEMVIGAHVSAMTVNARLWDAMHTGAML